MADKKTHIEVAQPEINVRFLADYMAASERKKRTIATNCKYRPLARMLQHNEAKAVVTNAIHSGAVTPEELKAKADFIRNKLTEDDFEATTNEANADFVKRFGEVFPTLSLPAAELSPGKPFPVQVINGVRISFAPNVLLRRQTKTNKLQRGALMLRYAKGKALSPVVAEYQSAAILGLLCMLPNTEQAEPEKALCLTLDAYSGTAYPAPGAAKTLWENTKAACASIAERWPAIKAPENAVL